MTIFADTSTKYESPLYVVHISFATDTYDEVELDVKVTMEAQLGLIGGTLGLLTGFSILSGIEILYFIIKGFLSLVKGGLIKRKA